jgi:hypothetical protein
MMAPEQALKKDRDDLRHLSEIISKRISLVFAEKFIGTQSSKIDRFILFFTWGLFFLALVSGGWALHQLHIAGSCSHMPSCKENIVEVAFRNALLRGEIGGILFGCGLLGLAFAAFRRVKSETGSVARPNKTIEG